MAGRVSAGIAPEVILLPLNSGSKMQWSDDTSHPIESAATLLEAFQSTQKPDTTDTTTLRLAAALTGAREPSLLKAGRSRSPPSRQLTADGTSEWEVGWG